MMTKKDFELIAAAIRRTNDKVKRTPGFFADAGDELWLLSHEMGHALRAQNPNFKQAVFMEACGVQLPFSPGLKEQAKRLEEQVLAAI